MSKRYYLEDGIPAEEREEVYAAAARRDEMMMKLQRNLMTTLIYLVYAVGLVAVITIILKLR